jgi:hypothetical protein
MYYLNLKIVLLVISGVHNALTATQFIAEGSQSEASVMNSIEISKRLSRPSTQDLSCTFAEKPDNTVRGKYITQKVR